MASTDSKSYTILSLWEKPAVTSLFEGLNLTKKLTPNSWFQVNNVDEKGSDSEVLQSLNELAVATKKFCSVCQANFESRNEQVSHYKSDWHCENLRRKQGLQTITYSDEQTSSTTEEEGEDEEDDGNDSDVEGNDLKETEKSVTHNMYNNRHAKLFFENKTGELFSFYKNIVLKKKEVIITKDELHRRLRQLLESDMWGIFLLGGGHCAAGIFNKGNVVHHKTFHRYVTRAKQGTTQSIHDHHNAHAKSAGANIRRQNELAFVNDVATLVQKWSDLLRECSHVFYRAPGKNKQILFSGKTPLFRKDDSRLRNIPFPTRRPTFKEVRRTYDMLSTIDCYGNSTTWAYDTLSPLEILTSLRGANQSQEIDIVNEMTAETSSENMPEKQYSGEVANTTESKIKNSNDGSWTPTAKAKRTRKTRKKNPGKVHQETPHHSTSSSCNSDEESVCLEFQDELLDTTFLDPYDVSIGPEGESDPGNKEEIKLRNALYTACKLNDITTFESLLKPLSNNTDTVISNLLLHIMNYSFGKSQTTLLHITSQQGFNELIWLLLENGADPAIHNLKGHPPYLCAANKTTKNTFRRFMASFPEKYNYILAQITSPLLPEEEEARRAKQRHNRQQKQQRQKALKHEQQQKMKYLSLTESERILLVQQGVDATRCLLCGELLGSRIPFEYEKYKFCTIKCLQQHRQTRKS